MHVSAVTGALILPILWGTSGDTLPASGLKPAPSQSRELSVLEGHIGTWDTSSVLDRPGSNSPGVKATGTMQMEWVLDKQFIRSAFSATRNVKKTETIVMYGFDPEAKTYRRWTYSSTGAMSQSMGTWDKSTKTITWKGEVGKGVTLVTDTRVVDPNTLEWKTTVTNSAGQTLAVQRGKAIRRK